MSKWKVAIRDISAPCMCIAEKEVSADNVAAAVDAAGVIAEELNQKYEDRNNVVCGVVQIFDGYSVKIQINKK